MSDENDVPQKSGTNISLLPSGLLNSLGVKAAIIGVLILLMQIPLFMISSLVDERTMRRDEVESKIADAWGHAQVVSGPMIIVPYQVARKYSNANQEALSTDHFVLLPDELDFSGNVDVETRSLGIFDAQVYTSKIAAKAKFQVPDSIKEIDPSKINWAGAWLAATFSDTKGLIGKPVLTVDGTIEDIKPGTLLTGLSKGIHTDIKNFEPGKTVTVDFDFSLRGSHSLHFWPSGKISNIELASGWPSPGFLGRFSPLKREVSSTGFKVNWQTTRLALGFDGLLDVDDTVFNKDLISVNFVDPMNSHKLTDRGVKYAVLFVILTFSILYLFEVVAYKQVHPVQYLLMGFALAMFFLSLLSLSEHLPFSLAYILAAGLVTLLMIYYGHVVTKTKRWTVGIGAVQTTLFAFLYGVLRLEDLALLGGTTLLFAALAVVMYLTRNVSWYGAASS